MLIAALAGAVAGGAVALLAPPAADVRGGAGQEAVAAELRALRELLAEQAAARTSPSSGREQAAARAAAAAAAAPVEALAPSASGELAAALRGLSASIERLAERSAARGGIAAEGDAPPDDGPAAVHRYLQAIPHGTAETRVDLFGRSTAHVLATLGRPDRTEVYDNTMKWSYRAPDGAIGSLSVTFFDGWVVRMTHERR
jgi:hypothetical protein